MKKTYRIRGIAAAVGALAALVGGVTLQRHGLAFPGGLLLSAGGAAAMFAAMWLGASTSEKASKGFAADQKDERTRLIRGKAAVIALFLVFGLLLAVGLWLATAGYPLPAGLVNGVLFIGLFTFAIARSIYEKKL